MLFQFLYGTIKSNVTSVSDDFNPNFNSYTVRLKEAYLKNQMWQNEISIPIRYD